jgi:hypothetical protein
MRSITLAALIILSTTYVTFAADNPLSDKPCCQIIAIDDGIITARDLRTGEQFTFAPNDPTQMYRAYVGQKLYAEKTTGRVWLDETRATDDRPRLTFGVRLWFTEGRSAFNFAGPSRNPNVLSELMWQGQNTRVYEVKADLVIHRFVSVVTLGWASIEKGTLRDQDFALSDRMAIASDTNTPQTDGFVVYGSLDVGPRLLQWKYKDMPGAVDFLVGFQFWREKYTARGLEVLVCNPAIIPCGIPPGGSLTANAITETITWQSFRFGPRVMIPLFPRVTAVGQFFFIPWLLYDNEDIHHLRTDLAQDPSGRIKASGGKGVELEGALQVKLWRNLRLEAGYRYWDVRSGTGTKDTFVPSGIVTPVDLNQANARRQGLFFGLDWTF